MLCQWLGGLLEVVRLAGEIAAVAHHVGVLVPLVVAVDLGLEVVVVLHQSGGGGDGHSQVFRPTLGAFPGHVSAP